MSNLSVEAAVKNSLKNRFLVVILTKSKYCVGKVSDQYARKH